MRCGGLRREALEALQRERQVRAPLGAGHGVDLVDDDVFDRAEDLTGARGQHEVERLGCGDEDVGRVAHDVAPLALGGVARAGGRAQGGHGAPGPLRLEGDAGQRRPQVAVDVVGQGLEGRDVEDPAPLLLERGRLLTDEPVDDPEEGGQGLARSRGRQDQAVLALADGLPALLLGGGRRRERTLEPGACQRGEPGE